MRSGFNPLHPCSRICLTNVILLCYNSITEQGQMFWGVRTLSSTLIRVHLVSINCGIRVYGMEGD